MTRLRAAVTRIPSWVKGVIEGVDASIAPLGSLASGLNFFPTPADRLAVRGGSAVVNTLHDADDTELDDVLRLDAFTPVGMVAVGWSGGESAHYLYRLTEDAAFVTGVEATSRVDLTASPSTGWNVGPRRPLGVELFEKLFLCDCTAVFSDRQPMLVIDGSGVLTQPRYALSGAVSATGTLTSTGVNVTAADTVTIGSQTYTFRATVGTTANEVLKGVDATASLGNLAQAIMADPAGSGTTFGSLTTANVDATAVSAALVLTATALYAGTGGNSIASTESAATLSWAHTTFTGGVGANAGPLYPLWVEEYNNVLFEGGYGDEGAEDVANMVRHSFLGQDPSDPATGFDPLAYNHLGANGVPVVAGKKGRGILLVFKPNEIYRVTGFGNAYPGWQYAVELVNNTFGYGVSNPWAVTFAEDYWYGWGVNGPFRTDGYTVESLRGPREFSWRLLNEFGQYWVEYHPDRRVVLFGVHPQQTEGARSATYPWMAWPWDLARQVWQPDVKFGQATHNPDYGAGFDLAHVKALNSTGIVGPTAPPAIAAVSSVSYHTFVANWTNGDSSASTEVWVSQATGPFALFDTAVPGAVTLTVLGQLEGNAYTVQVRHIKVGVTTAFSATTGWAPGPYPAPNPPSAITGATGISWTDASLDHDGLVVFPAEVSFVVVQAVDTLVLKSTLTGTVHTWTSVTAGTVITGFQPYPGSVGSSPEEQDFTFTATRGNYLLLDSAATTVNA